MPYLLNVIDGGGYSHNCAHQVNSDVLVSVHCLDNRFNHTDRCQQRRTGNCATLRLEKVSRSMGSCRYLASLHEENVH